LFALFITAKVLILIGLNKKIDKKTLLLSFIATFAIQNKTFKLCQKYQYADSKCLSRQSEN